MKSSPANVLLFDTSRNAFGIFKDAGVRNQLARHGLHIASERSQATIIVGETRRQLLKHFVPGAWTKKYFLYTDEPSFDTTATPEAWLVPGLKRFSVMNVFTGDVFTDATAFIPNFGLYQPLPALASESELRRRFEQKRIAAFLTYRPASECRRMVAGRDVDLNVLRIQLALAGHARGLTDVFGAGFAPGIVKDSTGWGATAPGEEWWDVKHRMLTTSYAFNQCAENTDWPNYITEKIWQSIRADCLPIYFGKNNGVRALFPADSYIEIADFSGAEALFDFVQSLTFDDFLGRLKKCRQVYQQVLEAWQAGRTDALDKRVDRIARRLLATAGRS